MEFHFGGFGFRILQKISEFEFFESSETKFESNEFLDYIQGLDVHEFSLINFDSNLIDYSILENFFDFIEKFTNDFLISVNIAKTDLKTLGLFSNYPFIRVKILIDNPVFDTEILKFLNTNHLKFFVSFEKISLTLIERIISENTIKNIEFSKITDIDAYKKLLHKLQQKEIRFVVKNIPLCALKGFEFNNFYAQQQTLDVISQNITEIDIPEQCSKCSLNKFCDTTSLNKNIIVKPYEIDSAIFLKNIVQIKRTIASSFRFVQLQKLIHQKVFAKQKKQTSTIESIYSIFTDFLIEKEGIVKTRDEILELWEEYVDNRKVEIDTKDLSIYVQIPYCKTNCKFCIYPSLCCVDDNIHAKYIEDLCEEIDIFSKKFKDTKFIALAIGGGTPSILKEELLEKLLTKLNNSFSFVDNAVKSFEFNAESSTLSKLRIFEKHGFNKVSIGVQSLDNDVLKKNLRYTTEEHIIRFFSDVRQTKIKYINADLIMGLPFDTPDKLCKSFEKLVELKPTLITIYPLKISNKFLVEKLPENYLQDCNKFFEEFSSKIIVLSKELGYTPNINYSNQTSKIQPMHFRSPEWNILSPHYYANFKSVPHSILGLGFVAQSHINNVGIYMFKPKDIVDVMFEKNIPKYFKDYEYTLFKFKKNYTKIKFICDEAVTRFEISISKYNNYFKRNILDDFYFELNELFWDKKIKFENDKILFNAINENELYYIMGRFLDTTVLK
ncbi:radical SAM protein [Candidatus Woesearchaeota archaeon]|nr:radical SAM protein [Candidatus Woesearchaeota archaeon]